jgi:hypothetical protein
MKASLLKALRKDAKAWWYNRELRERGRIADAASREADQVRRDVATLRRVIEHRDKCYVTCGLAGITIHLPEHTTIEQRVRKLEDYPVAHAAVALGASFIDYRAYSGDDIVSIILNAPIPDTSRDTDEEAGDNPPSLTYVTAAHYVDYMERQGIPVTRIPQKG